MVIVGFLVLIIVFLLLIMLMNCTANEAKGSALCKPMEPLISILQALMKR